MQEIPVFRERGYRDRERVPPTFQLFVVLPTLAVSPFVFLSQL